MRILFCFFFVASALGATTVRGRVENGTLGGDGLADRVQLVGLGQGMVTLAELPNVTGDFELIYEGDLTGQSWLIQATKGAAIYSVQGTSAAEPVVITVYDNSEEVDITARGGTIAVSAIQDTLDIGRFINLDNQSNPPRTLARTSGTFSFKLPPGFGKVEASTSRGTMPLRQQLDIAGDVATINYPLRPGRTQLMVRTAHPYDVSGENSYTIPLLDEQTFAHILVLPQSIDLQGEGLQFVSSDDEQGVKLYEWERQPGQTELQFTAIGMSAAEVPEVPSDNQSQEANSQAPKVTNEPHPMDTYRWPIVAGVVALMMISTFVLRRI